MSPLRFVTAAALTWALLGLAGCAADPASGWLGVNAHLGHPDYDGQWASAKTSELDRTIYYDLMTELGVPHVRDLVMSWARIQPAPGAAYDFSLSDELVRRAQDAGIDLHSLCWVIPRWAAAEPASDAGPQPGGGTTFSLGVPAREHRDAFEAFVGAFVERYDGNGRRDMKGLRRPIRSYEFMNEMEAVPPAEYAFWLKRFTATVKAADPSAIVALGGLKSPGLKLVTDPDGDYPTYFERLLSEPELAGAGYPRFDVVSFHCYPQNYPGRSPFDDPYAYLKRTMAAHNLSLPVWLTEYGYNSGAREEPAQTDHIVRWAIHARALGIDRVYLHCLWDYHWPGDGGAGENLGLVREVASGTVPPRKPAFKAFAMLLRELEDRPQVAQRGDGLYLLTGKGRPTYAAWRELSYDESSRLIPGWWEVRTLTGRVFTRQGSAIELTASPMFLQPVNSPFIH